MLPRGPNADSGQSNTHLISFKLPLSSTREGPGPRLAARNRSGERVTPVLSPLASGKDQGRGGAAPEFCALAGVWWGQGRGVSAVWGKFGAIIPFATAAWDHTHPSHGGSGYRWAPTEHIRGAKSQGKRPEVPWRWGAVPGPGLLGAGRLWRVPAPAPTPGPPPAATGFGQANELQAPCGWLSSPLGWVQGAWGRSRRGRE